MDTATIGALSAILGSLVGGTATATTSWMSQRALNRSKQIKDEVERREALYGESIPRTCPWSRLATSRSPRTAIPWKPSVRPVARN